MQTSSKNRRRQLLAALALGGMALSSGAMAATGQIEGSKMSTQQFAGFTGKTVNVNGQDIYYRIGGKGPFVLLIHGYTQTGAAWGPLATELAKSKTVVVPDIRGVGKSGLANDANYTKKAAAADLHALMAYLNVSQADVVGHDIGLMIAYAYAAQWPQSVHRLVVMDAPLPGVEPWEQVRANPALWHFNFYGETAEALVKGRERIYFEKFWNGFSANPKAVTESEREMFTSAFSRPGRMKAGFSYFAALQEDSKDNQLLAQGPKLAMPVLAMGGEKSAGGLVGMQFSQVATNVKSSVISGSGHWLLEEKPQQVMSEITEFLKN